MSLKHGLLGLLNYGSMTGYELDKTFKESLNFFWHSQTSQIYRELNAMENAGWLTSEIVIQTDKPNKKVYSITPAGREELLRWLSLDSTDNELSVRSAFLMKLFFSGERNTEENIQTLGTFKEKCEMALASMADTGDSIQDHSIQIEDPGKAIYWQATAKFGFYYYNMCIQWANDIIENLEKMK